MVFLLARYAAEARSSSSHVQPWEQLAKFTASDGSTGDRIGFAVALDGDIVVVGAPHFESTEKDAGAAYVYEKQGRWEDMVEIAKLVPSDGVAGDWFGNAVAVDKDTVFVSAPLHAANGYATGLVYVFEKPVGGWTDMVETAKLQPSDPSIGDWFGRSVAVDGDVVIVGASHTAAPVDAGDSGAAYIFVEQPGGWTDQTETAKLLPSDGDPWDCFGASVALDNSTAVIGSPHDDDSGRNSGSAYVYSEPGGGWASTTETAKLSPKAGAAYDWFGHSVAIFDDVITVGAPQNDALGSNVGAAYLFEMPEEGWKDMVETARLEPSDGQIGDLFSWSIAAGKDLVAAGAIFGAASEESGRIYLFEKPLSGWISMTETLTLRPDDAAAMDRFGISLAADWRTVVSGADFDDDTDPNSGSAYLFSQMGAVEIIKESVPEATATFSFTHNISGSVQDFDLQSGETILFREVSSGSYFVTESDAAPVYDLTALECVDTVDGGTVSTGDLATRTAIIELDPGETVTCRFVNTQRGQIKVNKITTPSAETQKFSFSLSGGPDDIIQDFSLSGSEDPYNSGELKPGLYVLSEADVAGWEQMTAACDNGDDPAALSLPAGETVQCTFTNRKIRFDYQFPLIMNLR